MLFKWVPFGSVAEMNAENVYEQLKKNELQIIVGEEVSMTPAKYASFYMNAFH